MERCTWCLGNEKLLRYHDEEWGVPLEDDPKQFEFLMLEAMQCGLNWNMMLQKREIFRACFAGFDPHKVADFGEEDICRILAAEGMIRSERKVRAVIQNARCFCRVQEEFGSFQRYLQSFAGERPILYAGHSSGALPAGNALSARIGKDLKKRGFSYLGPVTIYSHLQACGVINDHAEGCFRRRELLSRFPALRREPEEEF